MYPADLHRDASVIAVVRCIYPRTSISSFGNCDDNRRERFGQVMTRKVTRGSANVFADLSLADAEERQTKLRLAHAINAAIAERSLTQAQAGELLDAAQPKISALANYKLDGFSVERLMTFLTALYRDVQIVIKKKPRSRATGRISVQA